MAKIPGLGGLQLARDERKLETVRNSSGLGSVLPRGCWVGEQLPSPWQPDSPFALVNMLLVATHCPPSASPFDVVLPLSLSPVPHMFLLLILQEKAFGAPFFSLFFYQSS